MTLPRTRQIPKHDEASGALHGLLKQGQYSVTQLYGINAAKAGLYYELSKQPTVHNLMHQRKMAVHSTDIELYPKDPDNELATTAAEVLNTLFEESSLGLREFISGTFDEIGKFGFCLYNVVFTRDSRLELIKVPHYHVREWFTDENDKLTKVRCHNGTQEYYLEEGTFVWFGMLDQGIFWGESLLSPLLHHFVLYQQQILNDAESRAFAKGMVYLKGQVDEVGGALLSPNDEDIDAGLAMLGDWTSGKTQVLYLPSTLDVEFKQGAVSTADATENYDKFATIAREALGSTLKSLGIGGSGSLALGKEVNDADERAFSNAVNSYLDVINGFKNINSMLIDMLLDQLGFDELVGKRAVCFQMVTDEVGTDFDAENLPMLLQFVDKGLIDFDTLGEENLKRVYNALGLERVLTEEGSLEDTIDPEAVGADPVDVDEVPIDDVELADEDPYEVSEELRAAIEANMDGGNATARALAREILSNPDLDTAQEVITASKRNVSEANWNAIGGDLALDWARKASKKGAKTAELSEHFTAEGFLKMSEGRDPKAVEAIELGQYNKEQEMSIPAKYKEEWFTPPEAVQKVAKRALEWRKENNGKGGTAVGVARARDLAAGKRMSPATIKRMVSFFARHKGNEKPKAGKPAKKDKGRIAWDLWGGTPGETWCNKVAGWMESADDKKK